MSNINYLNDFKKRLLDCMCDTCDENSLKLIRRHDKNLEKGDYTFPSLTESRIWRRSMKNIDVSTLPELLPEIDRIEEKSGIVTLLLNRPTVLQQVLNDVELPHFTSPCDESKVVNCDLEKPNSSELTSARCENLCQVLGNILGRSDISVCASSTNLAVQMKSIADSTKGDVKGVRVGAVVGDDEKKVTDVTLSDYKLLVSERVSQLDEERRDDAESEEITRTRLECLVFASIQFSFLETSISNPVKMQTYNHNSSFVLYNLARMQQLLSTFEAMVSKNIFPSLPTTENTNFSLLKEPEEWEIVFNFVLTYSQIVEECVQSFALHKLVIFLNSFACIFSKYYNRVKILKDPLPHLVPNVHAKIHFVQILRDIVIHALDILNIKYVSKM